MVFQLEDAGRLQYIKGEIILLRRKLCLVLIATSILLCSCAQVPGSGVIDRPEEEQSTAVTEKNTQAMSEQEEPGSASNNNPIRIVVSWNKEFELEVILKGETDDGEVLYITNSDTEVNTEDGALVAEVIETVDGNQRCNTFLLYQTNSHLELEASNGPDNLMPDNIDADVYLDQDAAPIHFDMTEKVGYYRSYTGVWFWAPFGLDHGKLVDYDASWLNGGQQNSESEDIVEEENGDNDSPDKNEQRVLEQLEDAESLTFDEKIDLIRWVYYDIQDRLDEMEKEDGGSGTIRYIEDHLIRKIVAEPGTYSGHEDNCTAEYYYLNNVPLFVFAYSMGKEYRFYLDPGEFGSCIRYIDSEGQIYDYPEGGIPDGVTDLDYYCSMAFMELHWAGVLH